MMNILVISYFSPADKITGGFRAASFTKYFPEHGINTTLLTSNEDILNDKEMIDYYNFTDIEFVRGIRIRSIGYKLKVFSLMEFLKLDTFIFFPDIWRFWNRRLKKKALKLIKNNAYDAILVTGPPHSSFYAAYQIARKSNIPLVVDYRDPLMGNPFLSYPPIIKQIVRGKERKIVNYAKLVVTVGEEYAEIITNSLGIKNKKIHVINNGFFDYVSIDKMIKKDSKFVISYFGHFYLMRQTLFEFLIKAIREVIKNQNLTPERIVFQYAGKTSRNTLGRIIEKYDMADYFKDLGLLDEKHVLEEMSRSIINVVLIPPEATYNIPNKVYDYAFSNSHVLLIGEENCAVHNWFEKIDQKYTLSQRNLDSIVEDLLVLYEKWKDSSLYFGCNEDKLQEYNRKNQAFKMAELLKRELK